MLEALLAEAHAAGFRTKAIEATNRDGATVWWVDLYHPDRAGRKHGYGPDLATALNSALAAEETFTSTPTYDPCHKVTAALRQESAFVRRRL